MIAKRLERSLEALYRRLGARYLSVMRYLVVVIAVIVINPLAFLLLRYTDPEPLEAARSLAIGNGAMLTGLLGFMLPAWRRLCEPIERWLAGQQDDATALKAWEVARGLTWLGFRQSFVVAAVALPPVVAYSTWEYALDWAGAGSMSLGLVALFMITAAIAWPAIELFHRPVRIDLARSVRGRVSAVAEAPLAVRMWWSLVAVGLTTGLGVAFAAVPDGSLNDLGRVVLLAFVSTVLAGGVIIVLHIRSLLAPIDDLLEATRSVRAGDLSARAVVTTSDEIGLLAASLNEMLDGLAAAADEVRASRSRIVAAGEAERRRIERNIHDGAQQQLTALALELQLLHAKAAEESELARGLEAALSRLREAHGELRELAQGLYPSMLTADGLGPALELLAERSSVPVTVQADDDRYDETLEAAAYFVASEALANVAKYAQASSVAIGLEQRDGQVVLEVVDDGIGGAHMGEGSGLTGLADRVEAVGGSLAVDSPPGAGTTIRAILPVSGTGVLS